MTFPGLLNFLTTKDPPWDPLEWGGGQMFLGSNDSQINPHMRAKFGLRRSCRKGGGVKAHTHRERQRDAAALYSKFCNSPADSKNYNLRFVESEICAKLKFVYK